MSAPADGLGGSLAEELDALGEVVPTRRRLPVVQTKVVPRAELPPKEPQARRGRTLSMRRQSKRELERLRALYPDRGRVAPLTRGACPATRPCPYVSCGAHLALDVNEDNGNIKVNFPGADGEPDLSVMPETCALDVADRDGTTLEEIAAALGVTRERVRQLEDTALVKFRTSDPSAYAAMLELAGIVRSRKAPPLPPDEIIVDASGALSTADALDGLTDIAGARSYEPADDADDAVEASPLWEVA